MKYLLFLSAILLTTSCQQPLRSIGSKNIVVFDNTNLYFDMALKSGPSPFDDSILRLDAGRVLVKKITLPHYDIQPKVTATITLSSNGDPWDKSGSLFVIPQSKGVNLMNFEDGSFDITRFKEPYPAIKATSTENIDYLPNVELLRFMTPFGVGFFNDHERTKDRKPIYIPHWEESVQWSQDVTHLLPILEGEMYIGVYIDTWAKEGYSIKVSLDFEESVVVNHAKPHRKRVLPLVNTVKYAAGQRHFDGFSNADLAVDFELPENAANVKLHYLTTGHGGHSTGDEFVKRENIISLDNQLIKAFTPWRDDCASFRRFNPSSGTWQAKDIMENSTSTERIASSDFSRSNWCPGSDVVPEVIDLSDIENGSHRLVIAIPEAQAAKENEHNYWMVSAYLTYEIAQP